MLYIYIYTVTVVTAVIMSIIFLEDVDIITVVWYRLPYDINVMLNTIETRAIINLTDRRQPSSVRNRTINLFVINI